MLIRIQQSDTYRSWSATMPSTISFYPFITENLAQVCPEKWQNPHDRSQIVWLSKSVPTAGSTPRCSASSPVESSTRWIEPWPPSRILLAPRPPQGAPVENHAASAGRARGEECRLTLRRSSCRTTPTGWLGKGCGPNWRTLSRSLTEPEIHLWFQ